MRLSFKRVAMIGVLLVAGSSLALAQDVFNYGGAPVDMAPLDDAYDGSLASMTCVSLDNSGGAVANIGSVSVNMTVDHTWIGDLVIKVESPALTVTTLMSRPGFAEPADDGTGGFGDSSDLINTSSITFANGSPFDAELMGTGTVVCQDDGECDFFPNPDMGPGTDLDDFNGESAIGTWNFCIGDAAGGDTGFIHDVTLTVSSAACVFRMRIPNPEVDLGTPLEFRVRLEHNRPVTVTRAIFMEILDESGTVLFRRRTRQYTFNYLDVVNRMFSVNLPSRIVPGDYTLDVGLSGMAQGSVQATRAFTVMADGARQAAPESVVSSPGAVEYLTGAWTEAEAQGELPWDYALMQNYPNPFNPSTEIGFTLPESASVRLAVYDVLGRQVQLLLDGTMEAGTHAVTFDASDLPSGTYLYRLETPQGSVVRTMLLAK